MVPVPPVPRWVPYVAAVVWLGLVILSAVAGGESGFAARLAALLLGTVAPVAFAAAGGALVVQKWQQREWEHRTRYLVGVLLDEALEVLSELATTAYDVLVEALPERQRLTVQPISSAFRLPLADAQMESMRAAAVITKGVMMALSVASEDARDRAKRAHANYWNVFNEYTDTLREEQEALFKGDEELFRKAGELLGEQQLDDQPHEELTQPSVDDGMPSLPEFEKPRRRAEDTTPLADSDTNEHHVTPRAPRSEFPEGRLPFEIEPDVTFQREIIRGGIAVSKEFDLAAERLYEPLVQLSDYVPAQALRLVEAAVDFRGQIGKGPTADSRNTPEPSPTREAESQARGIHSTAWAAVQAAQQARGDADSAASEASQALNIARWVLSRLRSAFDLVFALDEVYRNRYRDPSRGIERAPIAIREAGNRNLDYLDHLTKAVQETIAALADAKENRQHMDGE